MSRDLSSLSSDLESIPIPSGTVMLSQTHALRGLRPASNPDYAYYQRGFAIGADGSVLRAFCFAYALPHVSAYVSGSLQDRRVKPYAVYKIF